MMITTAVIIGFEYVDGEYIPGMLADIFQVYSYAKRMGWKTYIGTDITNPRVPDNMGEYYYGKYIPSGIFDFVNNDFFTRKIVSSVDDLIIFMHNIPLSNRLLFYYSGHGSPEGIIMPGMERVHARTYSWNNIRYITSKINEVTYILDCCCAYHMDLLYIYNEQDDLWRLRSNVNFEKVKPGIYLVIASSSDIEKSLSTLRGSPFTMYLFSYLRNNTSRYSFRYIKHKLEDDMRVIHNINQSITIYNSHTISRTIWSWLVNMYIEITTNHSIDSIVILKRPNN